MSAAPGLRVRVARPQDALPLRELRRAVLAEGRWFATRVEEYGATVQQLRTMLAELAERPNGFSLVAVVGDEPIAWLVVHGERLARMAHLGRLEMMVRREHRGRGIGAALLREAIERAEANPLLRKLSLAVFEDNERAVALYERHGFVREGRREGEYLLEDGSLRADLLMARAVTR
jgi:ribosomal protein S18 acetylase RimI-like enzyme